MHFGECIFGVVGDVPNSAPTRYFNSHHDHARPEPRTRSFPFHDLRLFVGRAWRNGSGFDILAKRYSASAAATDHQFSTVLEMAASGLLCTLSNVWSYTTVGFLGSTKYQLAL